MGPCNSTYLTDACRERCWTSTECREGRIASANLTPTDVRPARIRCAHIRRAPDRTLSSHKQSPRYALRRNVGAPPGGLPLSLLAMSHQPVVTRSSGTRAHCTASRSPFGADFTWELYSSVLYFLMATATRMTLFRGRRQLIGWTMDIGHRPTARRGW